MGKSIAERGNRERRGDPEYATLAGKNKDKGERRRDIRSSRICQKKCFT